jgi:hypothetical protein
VSRLKLIYIVSLVIIGVLTAFTVSQPLKESKAYREVQRVQLLETNDQHILEFEIMNHEGKDKNYTINALIDGQLYKEDVLIPDGSIFTYIYHIYPDKLTEKKVGFVIYKEGEVNPFEETTYYFE